jgi:hypothetical protein
MAGNLTYKNGTDFDLAWSGGVAGDTFRIFLGGDKGLVDCAFDAGAGAATIPFVGVLDQAVGAGATNAVFSTSSLRKTTVVAGDYQVDVTLMHEMLGAYMTVQ